MRLCALRRLLDQSKELLTQIERDKQKIVYPVVSGTTFDDVSVDHASHYRTVALPLSPLNIEQSLELAGDRLAKKLESNSVKKIMNEMLFQVAIADTGGLPGVIIWAAEGATHRRTFEQGDYIAELVKATASYARFPLESRWKQSILCSLARPPLRFNSVLVPCQSESTASRDWTVKDASDSGSILLKESTSDKDLVELGVASCFVAASSNQWKLPLDTSVLFATVSKSDPWTWQRFREAHAHYCAAVLSALYKTRRFWSEDNQPMRLKHALRGAQSGSQCTLLDWVIEPQEDFNVTVSRDEKQCIPRSSCASLGLAVDTEDTKRVHIAKAGTPIIDAYFNLIARDFLNADERGLTVFIQYKHSTQIDASANIKVSDMNAAVTKLKETLSKYGWPKSQEWIFLWVTNRLVNTDVEPDEKLLWVGRHELCENAPLIGMRGLVPLEEGRDGE